MLSLRRVEGQSPDTASDFHIPYYAPQSSIFQGGQVEFLLAVEERFDGEDLLRCQRCPEIRVWRANVDGIGRGTSVLIATTVVGSDGAQKGDQRKEEGTHLKAILKTINTAPGVCIHIIGILNAPTTLCLAV